MNASSRTKPAIDLNKVPPIDHHRTAVTFNCLIMKMTEMLNNFGNKMEDILEKAEQSLDTADRKLRLMESKLAGMSLEDKSTTATPSSAPEIDEIHESNPSSSQIVEETVEEKPEEHTTTVLIKDDPAYSKYFKMLKLGVLEAGVIQKMKSEGVDPSILKRGDEPSRPQAQTSRNYESSGESTASFSDSD